MNKQLVHNATDTVQLSWWFSSSSSTAISWVSHALTSCFCSCSLTGAICPSFVGGGYFKRRLHSCLGSSALTGPKKNVGDSSESVINPKFIAIQKHRYGRSWGCNFASWVLPSSFELGRSSIAKQNVVDLDPTEIDSRDLPYFAGNMDIYQVRLNLVDLGVTNLQPDFYKMIVFSDQNCCY